MELELRLILLAVGLVIIGLIYVWGMRKKIQESLERRRRLKKQRSAETLLDAMPVISPAEVAQRRSDSAEPVLLDDVEVRVIDKTKGYKSLHEPAPASVADASESERDFERDPAGTSADIAADTADKTTAVSGASGIGVTVSTNADASQASSATSHYNTAEDEGMTVLLTVIAPTGRPFSGVSIYKASRELALPIGEHGVLECNTDTGAEKGVKTVFSVAHLREPGTFQANNWESLTTPGLLLFLQLPGPLPATEAVRMMFGVAGQLAEKLGGTVCDEKRRRFTQDGYVALHRQASQFEQNHPSLTEL